MQVEFSIDSARNSRSLVYGLIRMKIQEDYHFFDRNTDPDQPELWHHTKKAFHDDRGCDGCTT